MDRLTKLLEGIEDDLEGYMLGQNDPDCVTEFFDLNGRSAGNADNE